MGDAVSAPLAVPSTPSFLINGQPLAGAQPFETFQKIIETERAKKRGCADKRPRGAARHCVPPTAAPVRRGIGSRYLFA